MYGQHTRLESEILNKILSYHFCVESYTFFCIFCQARPRVSDCVFHAIPTQRHATARNCNGWAWGRGCSEPELTYQKAVDIALAFESTAKHAQDLGAKNSIEDRSGDLDLNVNQVKEDRQPQILGNTGTHYECDRSLQRETSGHCRKTGHIGKLCGTACAAVIENQK